jgi:hypothetical protein
MRTIPQIRSRLHELALELACPELADLAEETKRRSSIRRRTPTRHPKLTLEEEQIVRDYAQANPLRSLLEIAADLKTGLGRVSEAIMGKRG